MATFTGNDMRIWRETQKMTAPDLAERISCDVTTIYRYESGKLKPNVDTMYAICEALGDPDKWTVWMRTEYPASYGKVHPETTGYELPGAIMSMYAEIGDMLTLEKEALRDGADGRIDNQELRNRILKEVTEVIQSAQRVRTLTRG